jgi:hypothetical protein
MRCSPHTPRDPSAHHTFGAVAPPLERRRRVGFCLDQGTASEVGERAKGGTREKADQRAPPGCIVEHRVCERDRLIQVVEQNEHQRGLHRLYRIGALGVDPPSRR